MEQVKTILFVDDDPSVLESISRELYDEPYEILMAGTGEEALQYINTQEIAVVIADIAMPGMSGIELLKKLQQQHPLTVRIIISGSTNITCLLELINNNIISKYIPKPWNESVELKTIVAEAVEHYNDAKECEKMLSEN